ncbi:MAG: MFS transporter [Conexivisphaerales archaeon]
MTENVSEKDIIDLNGRIDRMRGLGVSYWVLVLVGVSYFFAFYDISAFGYSLDTLVRVFHWTTVETAIPGSTYLSGYIIGALIVGNVSDKLGRRNGLTLTVIFLTIGGILTALSWNLFTFSLFRLITGMGTGAELSIAATLVSEWSPAKYRGRFLQINYLWGAAGLGIAPFLILYFLGTALSWRLVFLFGAVVGFIILVLRKKFLMESPRWLLIHGKKEEAYEILAKMEKKAASRKSSKKSPFTVTEIAEPLEDVKVKVTFRELFSRKMIWRSLMVIAFWAFWYVTVYAWLGYEPFLLGKLNVTLPGGLLFVALSDLAFPIAAVIMVFIIEFGQRKYLVSGVSFLFSISSLAISFLYNPYYIFIAAFFGAFAIAANSAAYVYTAELFPTKLRTTGTAWGDGAGHIGGALAPFIAIAALDAYGARGAFEVLAIIVAISGFIVLLGPKTTGRSLTESSKVG